MLLVIDLGNTTVVYGLFSGKRLIKEWRFPTKKLKIPAIKPKIDRVVVASVVPHLNNKLRKLIKAKLKCNPFFVTADNIPGLSVPLKNKREIGADRVVDALAAYKLYGGPAIVVDFGTATTFDLISARGEYLGGAIAPGVILARDALYEHAAKLPKIKISAPKQVIGKNTVSAMQSGLVYGYVAMVEGVVRRIQASRRFDFVKGRDPDFPLFHKLMLSGQTTTPKVIATGGLAKLICKYTKVVDRIDAKLTLKGLCLIGGELNVRRT
ncbi:MAG: type III pantothenate kinase [Candidatus Saganbacteria bacterium]|nr:type III pantothenate kinase [Candidatus Saganbacteria bacterium]